MGGHRGFSLSWSRWQRRRAYWRGGSRGTGWTCSSSNSRCPQSRYPAASRAARPGTQEDTMTIRGWRTRVTLSSTWRSRRQARRTVPGATTGESAIDFPSRELFGEVSGCTRPRSRSTIGAKRRNETGWIQTEITFSLGLFSYFLLRAEHVEVLCELRRFIAVARRVRWLVDFRRDVRSF